MKKEIEVNRLRDREFVDESQNVKCIYETNLDIDTAIDTYAKDY